MAKKRFKITTSLAEDYGECVVELTAYEASLLTDVFNKMTQSVSNGEYCPFKATLEDIDETVTKRLWEKDFSVNREETFSEMEKRAKKFFKSLMEDEALCCDNNQMDGHKEYERMEGSLPSNPEEMIPFNDINELKNQEIKADISGLSLGGLK